MILSSFRYPLEASVTSCRKQVDGIEKSLSGRSDVLVELGVLAGFAAATMALGLWRLPWREK